MRKIATIFLSTFKNWLRSKSGVFFSILFPIMLLLIFCSVFGFEGSATYSLFIQNLDLKDERQTDLSKVLIEALNATNTLEINTIPNNVSALDFAKKRLGTFGGRIRILVIPKGFQDSLINGSTKIRMNIISDTFEQIRKRYGEYMSIREKEMMIEGEKAMREFSSRIRYENTSLILFVSKGDNSAPIVRAIVDSVVNMFNYRLIGAEPITKLVSEEVEVRRLRYVDYYLPGLISAFIMTNGVIGVTEVTTEYKRRGIIRRLATTPLTKFEWIIGNIITQTILAFMLTILMISVGWLIFGFRALPDAISLTVIAIGALLFSGMGLTIAGIVNDVEAATGLGNAVAFPMMFLSGAFWPIKIMPSWLQVVAEFMPLTYLSDALRASMIFQHFQSVIENLLVVGILTILFIVIGSLVTKWGE